MLLIYSMISFLRPYILFILDIILKKYISDLNKFLLLYSFSFFSSAAKLDKGIDNKLENTNDNFERFHKHASIARYLKKKEADKSSLKSPCWKYDVKFRILHRMPLPLPWILLNMSLLRRSQIVQKVHKNDTDIYPFPHVFLSPCTIFSYCFPFVLEILT